MTVPMLPHFSASEAALLAGGAPGERREEEEGDAVEEEEEEAYYDDEEEEEEYDDDGNDDDDDEEEEGEEASYIVAKGSKEGEHKMEDNLSLHFAYPSFGHFTSPAVARLSALSSCSSRSSSPSPRKRACALPQAKVWDPLVINSSTTNMATEACLSPVLPVFSSSAVAATTTASAHAASFQSLPLGQQEREEAQCFGSSRVHAFSLDVPPTKQGAVSYNSSSLASPPIKLWCAVLKAPYAETIILEEEADKEEEQEEGEELVGITGAVPTLNEAILTEVFRD